MKRGLVVWLLWSVSCARAVDALPRPAWVRSVSSRGGLCGNTLALDGDGDVWSEGGCESGALLLSRRRHADEGDAQRLRDSFGLFDAGFSCLPEPVDAEEVPPQGRGDAVSYAFLEASRTISWSRCETDGGEPFLTVEAAFEAL